MDAEWRDASKRGLSSVPGEEGMRTARKKRLHMGEIRQKECFKGTIRRKGRRKKRKEVNDDEVGYSSWLKIGRLRDTKEFVGSSCVSRISYRVVKDQ